MFGFEINTALGLFAGLVAVLDLASIYLRQGRVPTRAGNLRLGGALLMALLSAALLTGLVRVA